MPDDTLYPFNEEPCQWCNMLPIRGGEAERPMWQCNTWTSANGVIDRSDACFRIAQLLALTESLKRQRAVLQRKVELVQAAVQ